MELAHITGARADPLALRPVRMATVSGAHPSPAALGSVALGSVAVDSQDLLPGYAGAVGREGRIVFSRAAGLADVRSARPATPSLR